jgi:WD40 repeat protein
MISVKGCVRSGCQGGRRPGLGGPLSEEFQLLGESAPGTLVAGYRVEESLGAGGMAVVYRARDERLGRMVALKVLGPALAADEEFRRRFIAESRAAAAVDHPNIVPVYEAGQAGDALFIAMRLVTGGDLRQVLDREGPLPPARAAQFLSPVASALDAAHRAGLVHRDVKPANILVDRQPDRPEHVYLSDFGISKGTEPTTALTGTAHYLGTPEYTAPEQVKGRLVDGRADQYALACVAWHLLTGAVPFQRDLGMAVLFAHLYEPLPPLDALQHLPAAAAHVLARALAKDPGERYLSCGEFADALRNVLALPSYHPAAGAAGPAADVGHLGTADTAPAAPPVGPAARPAAAGITAGESASTARRGPRRRYLGIALAGTLLAAAAAVSLVLVTPGASRKPTAPSAGAAASTAAAAEKKTPPAAASTASGQATAPATPSVPPAGTLSATLADPGGKGARAAAFGPGGALLAIGDQNGRVYLWDTATRKLAGYLTDPASKGVRAVAFGPGGTLAAGDFNGSTYLWNTAAGTLAGTFADPGSKGVSSVAFGPDSTLAAADYVGRTYIWNTAEQGMVPGEVTTDSPDMSSVAFGPDGTLASGDGNGITFLLDPAAMGKLPPAPEPDMTDPLSQGVSSVAFGPGGILVTGDGNGSTYLWENATAKVERTFLAPNITMTDPDTDGVSSVAFGPGGLLATGDFNGSTYVWDTVASQATDKGTLTGDVTDPAGKGVSAVAFGPDSTLATVDKNGRVYLWHIGKHSS